MPRLLSFCSLVTLALSAGCATGRQPGALSPISARVTNEVITDDGQMFDAWSRRISAVQQRDGTPAASRSYIVARAAAWLAYARDAYAWDPRDGTADAALGETRRLVVALEHDSLPALDLTAGTSGVKVRPDLWATLARARDDGAITSAPSAMAEAEVALVRAARLVSDAGEGGTGTRMMTAGERACAMQLQVALAERLVVGLGVRPEATTFVALQGEPVSSTPAPAKVPEPVIAAMAPRVVLPAAVGPRRHGVERMVHFALNSSELSLESRVTLGEVISILRAHPRVNVRIDGYTDPRGGELLNRDLAVHRAEAVHRFLDGAALDLGRVTMEGIGTESSAIGHATVEAFARDRRVTLAFTDENGEPLTVAAYQALDINHDRDLQVEQAGNRRSEAAPRASDAALSPRTKR